jgi:prepilin-type N-terminal cleavage/methylation domain-containing protein
MLKKNSKGFTLLEVMVALTIVALSLIAVTSSIAQMIDSSSIGARL